ncbi:hypothetical protein [Sandarakinorhabdus sp. DWP1-3-1]|uniref:hypothetical protein n=1 Tax=Sandarakinorhabdus sp. DWP1-3-1 TaxID=2804627 RepID=UPI003CF29753
MIPVDQSATWRSIRHLIIIAVVLLGVTLPAWGIFAGGMLRDGNATGAAGFFGIVLAIVLIPILIVGAFSIAMRLFARRLGAVLHPAAVAGLGGILGTTLMAAFTSNLWMALILGVIPGAAVSLAVLPEGPRQKAGTEAG